MDTSITQKICNGIYFTDDKKLVTVEYNQLNSTLSRYNNNINAVRCAQIQNGHGSISSEPSALVRYPCLINLLDRFLHIIVMQVIDVEKSVITLYGESATQITRLAGYWE